MAPAFSGVRDKLRTVSVSCVAQNGFLSALPYLAMWLCSLLFGWLADWLIQTDRLSITNTRKLLTTICKYRELAGASVATQIEE